MNTFTDRWRQLEWDDIRLRINGKTAADVERALNASQLSRDDLMALLSPAAADYLEPLAQRAQKLTRQRCGNTVSFYVPLYLSNLCANDCTYCGADPVLCKRLEDVGCAAVMPLGAPIGSNQGLETKAMLEIIIQQATVPVVVDAGIGVPSHATQALEMGADAVLVNTAIAVADDPVMMATAFRLAVEAGLLARQAVPGSKSSLAQATSPLTGFLEALA